MKKVILFVFALWVISAVTLLAVEFRCEGVYPQHLQGFAADEESIYWSFTSLLMKSDSAGRRILQVDVPSHHGDCCVLDGKLYVATHLNWSHKERSSWIYVYDCRDLRFLKRIPMPEVDEAGVDGITFHDGFFYICIGKDSQDKTPYNWVFKMTKEFQLVERIQVPGETIYGIQACSWSNGFFWLGTYGKIGTIQCDSHFHVIAYHKMDMSVGVYELPPSPQGEPRLMVAQHRRETDDSPKNWAMVRSAILKNGHLEWEK